MITYYLGIYSREKVTGLERREDTWTLKEKGMSAVVK
jgi:hypothetical protein